MIGLQLSSSNKISPSSVFCDWNFRILVYSITPSCVGKCSLKMVYTVSIQTHSFPGDHINQGEYVNVHI